MIRLGDCKNCTNEKVYFALSWNRVINKTDEDMVKMYDRKIKNHSQCGISIIKSLDGTGIFGEVCRPSKFKKVDIPFAYKQLKIFNDKEEAAEWMANNSDLFADNNPYLGQ